MSETEKAPFPWKAMGIGIVLQALYLMFLFGYRCFYYVRGLTYTWTENYFDFLLFLGLAFILISVKSYISWKRGKPWAVDVKTLAIIWTFFNMSWPLTMLIARGPSHAGMIPLFFKELAHLVPDWWIISDAEAEKWHVGGTPNWAEWAAPIAFWSVHLISAILMVVFLNCIWRRQWIEVERLPYPHAVPVYEMINLGKAEGGSKPPIFREKFLWYGFIIALIIYIWDPLRMLSGGLIPRVPDFTIHYADWYGAPHLNLQAATKGSVLLAFSPAFMIGAYLLPLDVLLSIWVSIIIFHWLKPMIGIAAGVYPDLSPGEWWPFFLNNGWFFWPPNMTLGWGMWIGIFIWCFWAGRDHVKNIIAVLRGEAGATDDPVISYRWSVPLFLALALIWLATWIIGGATPIVSIAFVILFIVVFQAITRIKGEFWWGGRPLRFGGSLNWLACTYYYMPTGTYDASEAQVTYAFWNTWGSASLAQQCGFPPRANDCFKVAAEVGGLLRHVLIAAVIATVFGVIFGTFFRILWAYNGWGNTYGFGGNEGPGLAPWLYAGEYAEGGAYAGGVEIYALGAILAIILFFLKAKLLWWPINPIGFMAPIAGFWILPWEFLSFFFAWLWKYATWKIGGAPLHRKMLWIVIGFIAGYAIVNVFEWIVVVFIVGPGARPPPM